MIVINICFLLKFVIFIQFILFIECSHRTLEDAKTARNHLVKKYFKKLKKEEGAIKLVGGQHEYEGNIEILHDGKWGAICDDEWDKNEAEVVCRQLGYKGYEKITHSGTYGPAKRKFWMDNVLCDGKEKELANCRFDGWGNNDCEPSEAAGVICKHDEKHKIEELPKIHKQKKSKHKLHKKLYVRLAGGRTKDEGRVEVRFENTHIWGTICGDGWSLLEANVVCKSLGLGYANNAIESDFFNEVIGDEVALRKPPHIIMSGTECYGNETTLNECLHHEFGKIYCPGPKNYVAGVVCTHKMPDLVFDHTELETTAHLEDKPIYFLQCAMEENCLATQAYEIQRDNPSWHLETRRLLKFTARVLNAGNDDFRPSIPKHLWEWHMCHMHYHSMEVFATFNIYNEKGDKVAEGHKASFCLEDNQCLPGVEPRYACANYGDQGISVNCSDIYRYNIDCQWVDITELEPGTYTMKVSINPEFKVPEMSYDNNAASCTFLYSESYARIYNCKMERP